MTSTLRLLLRSSLLAALLVGQVGCSKKIGDACTLAADCGIQNNRQCDTAQQGGYCTQIGCTADGCPSEAACFLFGSRLSGCDYQDREAARTSRSFCMLSCESDSDCRVDYVCADMTGAPWLAVLLDTEELKPKACIFPATFREGGVSGAEEPDICKPVVTTGTDETDPDDASDAGGTDAEDVDAGP